MFDTLIHQYLRLPYSLYVHVDQKSKHPRAVVLLLHGIGHTGAAWDEIVKQLPDDIRIISMDLLGFGRSPAPHWVKYDIATQARSVIATLIKLRIRRPLIIVGHSMGALTAVEVAKRYPLLVESLVLCAPPLYNDDERRRLLPGPDKLLRHIYRLIIKNPSAVVRTAPVAAKFRVVGKAINITHDNIDTYIAALESSIIHQTSLQDIKRLKKPMRILYGALDPVVIKKNLDEVVRVNEYAKLTTVPGGHELMGVNLSATIRAIRASLPQGEAVS